MFPHRRHRCRPPRCSATCRPHGEHPENRGPLKSRLARGTPAAPPVIPLLLLGGAALLVRHRGRWGTAAAILLLLLGVVFVFGGFGEIFAPDPVTAPRVVLVVGGLIAAPRRYRTGEPRCRGTCGAIRAWCLILQSSRALSVEPVLQITRSRAISPFHRVRDIGTTVRYRRHLPREGVPISVSCRKKAPLKR